MSKVAGITELSTELAAKRGISKAEAKSIIEDFVSVMGSAIVDGGVSFKGVMTIKPTIRKARHGIIQMGERKGQPWQSEDKYVLSITTGSGMEAELNK